MDFYGVVWGNVIDASFDKTFNWPRHPEFCNRLLPSYIGQRRRNPGRVENNGRVTKSARIFSSLRSSFLRVAKPRIPL